MEKQKLKLMDSNKWANSLAEAIKKVEENKELWCSHCSKFTPYTDGLITFHGKNEKGEQISSTNHKDIFEYEGYVYICSKCGYVNEGITIDRIEI
jgi:rubrerythrin